MAFDSAARRDTEEKLSVLVNRCEEPERQWDRDAEKCTVIHPDRERPAFAEEPADKVIAPLMRVLVTGGAGFLGRAFSARARAAGHAVTTTDASRADVTCDISDPAEIWGLITKTAPEVVVHLAAVLGDAAQVNPVRATQINALGTAAVFDAAMRAKVGRIVYASSIAADAALGPATVFGATKAYGEHLARAIQAMPEAPAFVILRFGGLYGPGHDRGWHVGQEMIESFSRGDGDISYPDFKEAIDWTYVDDAAEILTRAVDRPLPPFAVFNVVGDRRTMADAVAHLTVRFPRARATSEPATAPVAATGLSNDGLLQALGYAPATRLEDGIDTLLGLKS
jgi:UDP-glucose 4-epimerase